MASFWRPGLGRPITKSMLILSHGTLGVDSGCKSPDFARVDLYLWQVSQVRTKSLTDFLIPGQ